MKIPLAEAMVVNGRSKEVPVRNPDEITLDELFAPDEKMERYDKMMLTRARRSVPRITHKPPYSGPQAREVRTVADLLKFRVEVGGRDFVHFIDKESGEIFEPPQFGDSAVDVIRKRLERFGFEIQVEYVTMAKKRIA